MFAQQKHVRVLWKYLNFTRKDDSFRRLLITRSASQVSRRKKDYLAHEKIQIADYGEVQKSRKRVYMFGSATEGALGLSNLLKPKTKLQSVYQFLHHPVRNSFGGLKEVLDIAAGHGFTLVKVKGSKEGSSVVYASGLNTHSQLGYQAVRAGAPLKMLIGLAPLPLPLFNGRVLAIGCGRAHSLISIEGSGLVALGDNSSGQCGRLPISDEEYFGSRYVHRIPPFGHTSEDDVISIASKFDITLCLTQGGKVYSFGTNNKGQLGRGSRVFKHWEPNLIENDLKGEFVLKIATSGNSVFAVTRSGNLFAWGSNESGHINPEKPGQIFYEPRHVPLKSTVGRVLDAATGDQFSHILNERGEVYGWGVGECLGLGPRSVRITKPMLLPPPLFGRNDLNPDVTVDKVFSGFFYAAAVNSRGDVYTWGRNEAGCLGLGLNRDDIQYFPLRVSLAGFVEKVCIGVDHTVVLSRGGV